MGPFPSPFTVFLDQRLVDQRKITNAFLDTNLALIMGLAKRLLDLPTLEESDDEDPDRRETEPKDGAHTVDNEQGLPVRQSQCKHDGAAMQHAFANTERK